MRRSRLVLTCRAAVLTVLTTAALSGSARGDAADPPAVAPGGALVVYSVPVRPLVVLRGFEPPATRYGPGHLGVDLRASNDGIVRAAGQGTVSFAGQVAGRGVVVILHPDGIRTEYEPVRPLVRAGTEVARGQPVGVVSGAHRGCPGRCVHWGARRGQQYLDPLTLLRPLGPVRLLPWTPDG